MVALLDWGASVRRDLPWRASRDPWAVLVSEIMCQQTQVERAVPRWFHFLERWPTPTHCADATLSEVLDEWAGLGYPRRARDLWNAARIVRDEHGGLVPDDLEALMALPGVGAYTARAVQAFAFEIDAAVVDTNIARVLARCSGRRLTAGQAQRCADEWLSRGRAWEHNQSLMDLGAILCRAAPQCGACPLASSCAWRVDGYPDPDPAVGSAGVSRRQPPFAGSDRQGRGRLMEALRTATVSVVELPAVMGWPLDPQRASKVAATLVADGLIREVDGAYRLGA